MFVVKVKVFIGFYVKTKSCGGNRLGLQISTKATTIRKYLIKDHPNHYLVYQFS